MADRIMRSAPMCRLSRECRRPNFTTSVRSRPRNLSRAVLGGELLHLPPQLPSFRRQRVDRPGSTGLL
jgi:hypothetical protein